MGRRWNPAKQAEMILRRRCDHSYRMTGNFMLYQQTLEHNIWLDKSYFSLRRLNKERMGDEELETVSINNTLRKSHYMHLRLGKPSELAFSWRGTEDQRDNLKN